MTYEGKSERVRVRIVACASARYLERYFGQYCDAIFYDDGHAQIDTEQLHPPIPKWQSCKQTDLAVVPPSSAPAENAVDQSGARKEK